MLLSTWFGTGLIKPASGTWGSLASLPFAWFLCDLGGTLALALATLTVFAVGIWAASIYSEVLSEVDPSQIVIDEVAGQWLTLLVVPPNLLFYAIGLIFFRIFDIIKPWPVSWADRHFKGGLGIMLDDILAGVYAATALFFVHLFLY